MCLFEQGDFLVVFRDAVVWSKILSTVHMFLTTLVYWYIILSIFICCTTLCSRLHITSSWRLNRYGIGWLWRVSEWLPWGAMGDPICQCVQTAVFHYMVNVWQGAWLMVEYSSAGLSVGYNDIFLLNLWCLSWQKFLFWMCWTLCQHGMIIGACL